MQRAMTTITSAKTKLALAAMATMAGCLMATQAMAQNLPVTPGQKAVAQQVAQAGLPLSELAANAPDNYTVKPGDTLWAISGMFLKSAWRWPELWGMNLNEIRNPHRIYPGQQLVLERLNGRARLRMAGASGEGPPTETIRVSPRVRYESVDDGTLPTLKASLIEPFLAEPIIVDENGLSSAPRIVATQEGRVLLTRGDRAYARGNIETPLLDAPGKQQAYRIFRNATPLKDPTSGEVLGYEAQYVGKALLVSGESTQTVTDKNGKQSIEVTPATIDIVAAKEEMRVGDRLVPEPERELVNYTPRAPSGKVDGHIVSVYGSAVVNAAQNQVVVINRGSRDGMERGFVLAILKDGGRLVDKTDTRNTMLKLPDERNGLLMVFRTFDRLSYALVLDIRDGVKVGDRLANPR
jgi:nucleoid-associated protein YgaU